MTDGINRLPDLVATRMVVDMRTAREQREANTVLAKHAMLDNLRQQQWHAQRAIIRIEDESPWSRPSCAIMSLCLGNIYAFGNGPVPV